MVRDAAIFDVDGTLCDVSSIRHYVMGQSNDGVTRPKDFKRFHDEAINCPPHHWVADLARQAMVDGLDILIVTSRQERWLYPTLWWLWEHSIPYTHLFMRATNDPRKDAVVKKEIYRKIRRMRYSTAFAVDDNPSIIALWELYGIPVIRVPGWKDD